MTTPGATQKGDFIFDSFFTGLIGGTVVVVVLLALDLILVLLVMLEAGVRIMSAILAPGLVDAVSPGRVLISNAAAAAAMGGFLIYAQGEDTPPAV